MTDRPGEFWKNEKTDLLLARDPKAEKVTWAEFKLSFKPLDTVLEAQLKLRDLKMKARADKYMYQFAYLAKQTEYNDMAQIVAFKQGLLKSLKKEETAVKKIMEADKKKYMAKGLCFQCGRSGHCIRDCPDGVKKEGTKREEPKKLMKEERFAKIQVLVNDQTDKEKNQLLDLMEQTAKIDQNSMHLPLQYKVGNQSVKAQALLDSRAEGRFISLLLARRLGKKWEKLPEQIKVFNMDGTSNKTTWISHMVEIEFQIQGKEFKENFLILGIGEEEMILGLPWLRAHNPKIDWEMGEIEFPPKRKIHIKRFVEILDTTPAEVLIRAKTTMSQELAHQKEEMKKNIDDLIPPYLQGYQDQFEKGKSKHFPPSRTYDHTIELKPDFVPHNCKLYPLSPTEQHEQDKFLEENLRKGYIRKSKSPMASPFFVAKKEKEALRPTQDYHELNKRTIKNAYPLPLVSELLDKLKGATVFSKLDLRNGYNNVWIKDGDYWKAAFKTNRGLFEPTVMFFSLSNSLATFQAFMNNILSDFIDKEWCVVYMDNILLFSKNSEEHREQTERLLKRIHEHNLYLKPEKSIDSVKLARIADWEAPRTVKGVQSFLGFGNFYRKFIGRYSHIAKPLHDLTKKLQKFKWTPECQMSFELLKKKFLSEPVLIMPDTDKPFIIEADALKWATGAVLQQQGEDREWHPCGYLSKSLSSMEQNYKIYDRELLVIVQALME
ncbi:hypothetical protein Moror_15425 [Moniliophthora roreri MCA 2997]|uniref:Reverse transcriptase-rnase h-integrase n=1 Tax=Moniliophthora roreri (strain MCA 2997) TaxID=1381753 RepID=V2XMW6_MONRO|nr:hypothetical protein Moror_15425 [Moniliophthora roreri MCA 2997]